MLGVRELEEQMRAKNAFQVAFTGLFMMGVTAWAEPLQQPQPTALHWSELPANISANLRAEGIQIEKYERLLRGEVLTESRSVPAGKSGVHMAAFGAIRGSADKLWNELGDCGNSPPILPYLQSCKVVESDHPLPPNRRWEELKIDFRMAFFSIKTTVVNEMTFETPNYLRWNQVRGDAKISEGSFRIISLTPGTQIVAYEALVDSGPLVPGFIETWALKNTLQELITALRDRVQSPDNLQLKFSRK